MRIFFIRHGESVANKEKVFQGWTDVSLSEKGHEQAKNLAKYFRRNNIHFNRIYSSPLKRAVETAQYLVPLSDFPELVTFKGFRSINVGQWAGLTIDGIEESYSKDYRKWKTKPKEFCFPKGESVIDVQKRAKLNLDKIVEEHERLEHDIVIVTHMITIKVLILLLLDLDLNLIWQPHYAIPNTSIVVFEVKKIPENDRLCFKEITTESRTPHLY